MLLNENFLSKLIFCHNYLFRSLRSWRINILFVYKHKLYPLRFNFVSDWTKSRCRMAVAATVFKMSSQRFTKLQTFSIKVKFITALRHALQSSLIWDQCSLKTIESRIAEPSLIKHTVQTIFCFNQSASFCFVTCY